MKISKQPLMWQVGLILFAGIIAISTSAIFIRLAITSAQVSGVGFSLFLSASRLTLASLLLIPAWRNFHSIPLTPGALRYGVAAGICLALHFATWITSLSFTSITASTTLVATNPIWVALLSWFWYKEKLTRITVLGISIAFIGGVLIALGNQETVNVVKNPLLGNLLALVGAFMGSLYLLFGKEAQRRGLGIGSYVAVAYSTGALVLLPLPLVFGVNYFGYPNLVYFYVLLTAILPQMVGHTSFNWAMRYLSPTLVTLTILCEPVGASFLGYLIFHEIPGVHVIVGAIVLLSGVAIAIIGTQTENID